MKTLQTFHKHSKLNALSKCCLSPQIELVINYGKSKLRKESTGKVVGKLSSSKTKMDEKCGDSGDHRSKRIKVDNNRAEDSCSLLANAHLSGNLQSCSGSLASPSSSHLTGNLNGNLTGNLTSLLPSSPLAYPVTSRTNSINSFGNSTGALVWQERSG